MKKIIITLLALALTAAAQDAPKWQQKVFDVKYADAQALARLVLSVMQSRETRVIENVALRAISVGTPEPRDMTTAEEIIKRYDVPRGAAPAGNRNIELIAYMLIAAPKGTAGDALPAELDPVAKQLKAVFGYNDLRLLDSALIRTREGVPVEASGTAGSVSPAVPNRAAHYLLRFARSALVSSERGNTIRLDGFRFTLRVPYSVEQAQAAPGTPSQAPQYNYSEVGFNTELDIREGQKVVVGKAKVDTTGSAFMLVLTAKALD